MHINSTITQDWPVPVDTLYTAKIELMFFEIK